MERIIMSSNAVDSHGEIMTKEALESAVVQINGKRKLPYNMNHKRELPPLGIMLDGRLEEENDLVLLTALPLLFPNREVIDFEGMQFIKEGFDEDLSIVSRYDEDATGLSISVDPSNFSSNEEHARIGKIIYELDNEVSLRMHGRKSQMPSPEIIISVAAATELAKFVIKKIAEDVLHDGYEEGKKKLKKFALYAANVMKLTRQKAIPKNKRFTTIFEIHTTPFIELVVKSDDPTLISKGLNERKLLFVKNEIQKFTNHFSVNRIQFILTDAGNWKFNYLITEKGEAIGQKSSFNERDRQYKRYEMQSKTLASHRINKKPLIKRGNGKDSWDFGHKSK